MKQTGFGLSLAYFFASFFYLGYLPGCPGTIASIATALPLFFMPQISLWIYLVAIAVIFLLGVWLTAIIERHDEIIDPSYAVIDEVVGMSFALVAVPQVWWQYGIVLALFRFFDIVKPFPIRQLERNLMGGFAIMIDDVVASVFSIVIFWSLKGLLGF